MLFCCKLWLNGAKNYACGEKVTNIRYANGWYHDIKRVLLRFGRINPICWNEYINHYRTVLNVDEWTQCLNIYVTKLFVRSTALHCEEKDLRRRSRRGRRRATGNERQRRRRAARECWCPEQDWWSFPVAASRLYRSQPAELRCQENPPDVPTLPYPTLP